MNILAWQRKKANRSSLLNFNAKTRKYTYIFSIHMYANINSNFNHIRLDLDRLLWTVCMLLWHCYLLSLLVFPHDMNMRPWIEHEVVGKYGFEINVNRHVHVYSLIFCYIVHLIKQWKEFNMLKKKMKAKKSTQISSDKKKQYIWSTRRKTTMYIQIVST